MLDEGKGALLSLDDAGIYASPVVSGEEHLALHVQEVDAGTAHHLAVLKAWKLCFM